MTIIVDVINNPTSTLNNSRHRVKKSKKLNYFSVAIIFFIQPPITEAMGCASSSDCSIIREIEADAAEISLSTDKGRYKGS